MKKYTVKKIYEENERKTKFENDFTKGLSFEDVQKKLYIEAYRWRNGGGVVVEKTDFEVIIEDEAGEERIIYRAYEEDEDGNI